MTKRKAAKKTGLQIVDCEQRSPEWFAARAGIPTASMFKAVMAGGRDGGDSLTRTKYMRQLAGEILTGDPMESYDNDDMARGRELEDEALRHYALETGHDLEKIGFMRNGQKGASPDRLILKRRGIVEMKIAKPHILIEHFERNVFPAPHRAQCQGSLWVGEMEIGELAIYCPKMPMFRKKFSRDEMYIRRLADGVEAFNEELDALVRKMRGYGA